MTASKATLLLVLGMVCVSCGENPRHTHEGPLLDNDVLKLRVQSALHRAGAEFDSVHARAVDGEVMLTGEVDSAADMAQAAAIAQAVYGVKKVDIEIKVR